MDLVVYDDEERRYVPWGVVLSALLLVAAVVGAVTFLLGRSASGVEEVTGLSAPQPATASATASPSAGASPAPACLEALRSADVALERSTQLEQALAEHTRLMDQLLAGQLDPEQALEQTLPVLTSGATDRRRFEEELAAYERLRQECPGN